MVRLKGDQTNRNAYYDNVKAILIFLMVFGHLLILGLRDQGDVFFMYLWRIVYSFHMPAFFFLSGILEKRHSKTKNVRSAISTLAMYGLMCLYTYGIQWAAGHDVDWRLLRPPFGAWFLLVLFLFKLAVPLAAQLRWLVPLVMVLSLGSGLVDDIGMFLSLQRAFAFSVFFFAGYKTPDRLLGRIENFRWSARLAGAAGAFAALVIATHLSISQGLSLEIYFNKIPYSAYTSDEMFGVPLRAAFIITAFLGIFMVLCLAPRERNLFSYVGGNTSSVYFFHTGLFYLLAKSTFDPVTGSGVLLAVITLVYVLVTASVLFSKPLNAVLAAVMKIFVIKS